MTAQAHLQVCRSHEQRATALETAQRFDKRYSDNTGMYERDVAMQHGRAAHAVDPNAPACP